MSYITFKTIGESGNLGSQLQQYSSLYAIAKETGKQIVFPESSLTKGFGFKFAELLDLELTTAPDDFFSTFVDVRPNDLLPVDYNIFNLDKNINYNIVNRFDLLHYWYPKYGDDINTWGWNKEHLRTAQTLYDQIALPNKETIAMHVRRGDYLLPQHDHFCKLDHSYYLQALQMFADGIENYQILIFSNDIDWCKENLIEESDTVSFVQQGSDYVDLILMSLCNHQIIANSSYSWWAAYKNININKQVVCPTNYLKRNSPWAHINGRYYPPTWINIDNEN